MRLYVPALLMALALSASAAQAGQQSHQQRQSLDYRMAVAACRDNLPYPTNQWQENHEEAQCAQAAQWALNHRR